MAIIVQKYGGSSVADVDKLRAVASKVVAARREGHDVVVVVSAMGKTTDQLIALAKQVVESPPRRELDMLLTTGERVSMALLSMAIQHHGVDAISFTGSQSGIITNDRHFDAKIIEVRPHRIEDELARGKVVIVAGYQGMSYRREITTLGRGGSDTTALALAAAIGAERAEIYSDVDGVYSADPRVVSEAKHLPTMTYETMQEMAEAGAKVLHAEAVGFARRAKISIHARSTFAPGRETVVQESSNTTARAAVCQRGVVRARIEAGPERLRRALEIASSRSIAAIDLESTPARSSFSITTGSAPDLAALRAELQSELGDALVLESGLATTSLVGEGLARDPHVLVEALAALHDRKIAPRRVATSALRLSFDVEEREADQATQALHERLVAPVLG